MVCGCGYRLVTGQACLPDGSRSLSIPQARNETVEPAAGALLVEELRRQAGRAGLEIDSAAPAVLEVRIVRLEDLVEAATMIGGRYHSRQQRLLLVADATLRGGDKILWQGRLAETVHYLSAPDLRGTESNHRQALREAAYRMAREVLEQIAARY